MKEAYCRQKRGGELWGSASELLPTTASYKKEVGNQELEVHTSKKDSLRTFTAQNSLSPAYAITNRHKNLGSLAQSDRVPADLQRESLIMDVKQEKRSAGNSKKGTQNL